MGTGIQFGKTKAGAFFMKRAMHTYTEKDDAFIVTAPNYKILNQSTLPAFLSAMDGYGEYKKVDAEFKMHNGGTCYFRTNTDPDSIVGVTNVRAVWGDEAGKYSLYFWENIQGRASFKDCPILLTTSPYSMNWVFQEIIKPKLRGEREDVNLIQASSIENPYFPREEYERRKKTMDPRRFNMMYGGEWGKMEGLVYDCFDEDENMVTPFVLPTGTWYTAGVDWGYNDPFVICIRAHTIDGRHYRVGEFYKTGLTIRDMIEVAQQKKAVFGIKNFYCDPSQPGYIEEFNRNGLTAIPANNDIDIGISLHYEMIRTRKLKFFTGTCPHTIDEMQGYHYPSPRDLLPDQNAKAIKPVGQNDHCMDADRYDTIMTYKSHGKRTPKLPDEINRIKSKDRLKSLLKTKNTKHSENWS